jgi:DNA-binding CsgD family transcriptional regulator
MKESDARPGQDEASRHQQRRCGTLERNAEIVRRALSGETLTEISRSLGITRERVRQLVRRAGVTPEQTQRAQERQKRQKLRRLVERIGNRAQSVPECSEPTERNGEVLEDEEGGDEEATAWVM